MFKIRTCVFICCIFVFLRCKINKVVVVVVGKTKKFVVLK